MRSRDVDSCPASTRVDGPRVRSEKAIEVAFRGFLSLRPDRARAYARDMSSHAASAAPIGAAIDARARPRVGTVATRHPNVSDSREAKNRFAASPRRRCHPFRWFPRGNADDSARKKKRANPKRVAHPFEPSIVKIKQDQTTEIARKKKRSVKTNNRSIVGRLGGYPEEARGEVGWPPRARAALRGVKERQRKAKDAKKGKK